MEFIPNTYGKTQIIKILTYCAVDLEIWQIGGQLQAAYERIPGDKEKNEFVQQLWVELKKNSRIFGKRADKRREIERWIQSRKFKVGLEKDAAGRYEAVVYEAVLSENVGEPASSSFASKETTGPLNIFKLDDDKKRVVDTIYDGLTKEGYLKEKTKRAFNRFFFGKSLADFKKICWYGSIASLRYFLKGLPLKQENGGDRYKFAAPCFEIANKWETRPTITTGQLSNAKQLREKDKAKLDRILEMFKIASSPPKKLS